MRRSMKAGDLMIDNFDKIQKFMEGRSRSYNTDLFYRVEIKRHKYDYPDENTEWRNRTITTFCVANAQDLLNLKPRIVEVCDRMSARAGIKVNRTSYMDAAIGAMRRILQCFPLSSEGAKSAWDFCAMTLNSEEKDDRYWITYVPRSSVMWSDDEDELISKFIAHTKIHATLDRIFVLKDSNGVQILHPQFRMNQATETVHALKEEGKLVKNSSALLYYKGD